MIEENHEPVIKGNTWRDLAIYSIELRQTVRQCNIDKALMREWDEGN